MINILKSIVDYFFSSIKCMPKVIYKNNHKTLIDNSNVLAKKKNDSSLIVKYEVENQPDNTSKVFEKRDLT